MEAESIAPRVWAFRAGPSDQRAGWALHNGTTPGGFGLVPDLSEFTSRDEIREVVRSVRPDHKPGNWAGQLWALRTDIAVGDMIVMPCPDRMFAFGRVREEYTYRSEEPESDRRHILGVDWVRPEIRADTLCPDLSRSLTAALTISRPRAADAAMRVAHILATSEDPGSLRVSPGAEGSALAPETLAREQLGQCIEEQFHGHEFAELIAELLRTEQFICEVSKPGKDGGVDILVKPDLRDFGFRMIVEVKSGRKRTNDEVVMKWQAAVANAQRPYAGLIVCWGGLTRDARERLQSGPPGFTLWERDDVIDRFLEAREALPDWVRKKVPLQDTAN